MTLHYYSPKGYNFLQKLIALPNSSSIRTWAVSVDCETGYLLNVIKLIGEMGVEKPWTSDKVLVVDATPLHKGMYGIKKQNNMWAQLTMDLLY